MTTYLTDHARTGARMVALTLLLAITAQGVAADTDTQNYIANGNAENADAQGLPGSWSVYARTGSITLSRSTEDRTEGEASARIELGAEGANFDIRIGRPTLKPRATDATFLFTADVKTEFHKSGILAGYFCVGAGDRLHIGKFEHNAGWQKVRLEVIVPAGATVGRLELSGGRAAPAVILIDNASLTFLHEGISQAVKQAERAAEKPPATLHPGIVIKPNAPVRVTKLLPTASHLVHANAHGPVDGRTDTRYATGVVSEWSGSYGVPSVSYRAFNGNNGFHVTLPEGGFDAMLVRGKWEGNVYADHQGLLEPGDAIKPLGDVYPANGVYRQLLSERSHARRVSFYYRDQDTKKTLNDITFLRVDRDAPARAAGEDVVLQLGGVVEPDPIIAGAIAMRYGEGAAVHQLGKSAKAIALEANQYLHMMTAPQDVSRGISAMTLVLDVEQADAADLAVRVQDVLDPRRAVMAADLHIAGPGRYTITLDHPDQVFLPSEDQWPAPPRLDGAITPSPVAWLSLASSSSIKLTAASVTLHHTSRDEAMVDAGAWRMFLLKGLFQAMSEPRPWMHLKDGTPIREQIATSPAIARYQLSLTEALETVEITRALLPNDDVVRQYHEWMYQNIDRRKPQPAAVWPVVPGAPQWAVGIREGWRHVSHIATWWLDNRLVDNGELGGGIGDDTDMFQTWQCLPMIESAPLGDRLKDVSNRLTHSALETMLEEGINKHPMDALHAYEEGINQLALNAWWFYGDPVHFERVMDSARSVLKLLYETEDGRVHFGSKYMSIREARHGYESIGKSPGSGNWAPARLMLHPLYVVGLYNNNPAVKDKFERWGKTWRDYQQKGAYVGQVDITTGKPTIVTPLPSADGHGPVDEWLALYHMTADPKWREPFTFMMDSGGYWGTTVQYGRLAHALVDWPEKHQEKMRDRISGKNNGYAGFFLHKDRAHLESELDKSMSWFSRFPHMDTAAEQKTDRVLTYKATVPLACYLGDAPNRNRWLNFTAVSYEGLRGEDYAALVWDAGNNRLKVALYNFTDKELTGNLRTWRLDHGRYQVRIGADTDDDGAIDTASIDREQVLLRGSSLELQLPSKQVTVVTVEQLEQLDDIRTRSDLALSAMETKVEGNRVAGVVHNIGAVAADVVVAVVDKNDKVVATKSLGNLEAPLDLNPRRLAFTLDIPGGMRSGLRLVVDPASQVSEITEMNNIVSLDPR